MAAVGMIIERKEGSYERLTTQGVSDVELLLSHIITDFLIVLCQCIILLVVTFGICQLTNEGSMTAIFSLTVLTAISGMCFGFLISCFCDNEQTAAIIALGTFMPVVMLCGMIWPREAMYPSLQVISYFLPLTKNTESMRAILHRGWTISVPLVYHGFLYTLLWIIVFLILCVFALKIKRHSS